MLQPETEWGSAFRSKRMRLNEIKIDTEKRKRQKGRDEDKQTGEQERRKKMLCQHFRTGTNAAL